MEDVCCNCGKQVPWVEFFRCEKCDGNVCKDCIVATEQGQACPKCAGGER